MSGVGGQDRGVIKAVESKIDRAWCLRVVP